MLARGRALVALSTLVVGGALLLAPTVAGAATFTVDTTQDLDNGPAGCADASPATPCSVRDALAAAAVDGTADRVVLGPGTYVLSHGQLVATGPDGLEISGPGPVQAAISGADASRVLLVETSTTVEGLTIRNGLIDQSPGGGGILVNDVASFALRDSVVRDNVAQATASTANGGGILVRQLQDEEHTEATIEDSVVLDNQAGTGVGGASGGGILADASNGGSGELTVLRSTISGNSVLTGHDTTATGGGIYTDFDAEIDRSTVSGNTVHGQGIPGEFGGGQGGGINGGGIPGTTIEIANSTISGNTASADGPSSNFANGGGIHGGAASFVVLTHVTLAGNIAAAPQTASGGNVATDTNLALLNTVLSSGQPDNCSQPATASTASLDSGTSCGIGSANGNLSGVDPLLGPLAANGGPTRTHALPVESPARNVSDVGCLAIDQRGVPRPQLQLCDLGAYEARAAGAVRVTKARAVVSRGRTAIRLACSGDPGASCGGALALTVRLRLVKGKVRKSKQPLRVGFASYGALQAGGERPVSLSLNRRGLRLLAKVKKGRLPATAVVTQTTPAGSGASRQVTLVRAPKKKKKK